MKLKRFLSAAAAAAVLVGAVPCPAIAAETDEVLLTNDFEESFGTWKARTSGSTEISLSDTTANSGSKSLYVTGRTTNWNGAGASMIKVMYAGNQYKLSVAVYYDDETVGGQQQQFSLQCLYTDSEGKERYGYISGTQVKCGEWAQITGTYNVPEDARNLVVYVEAGTLSDFYIDDFSVEGPPASGETAEDGFSDDFEDGTKMSWQGRGSNTTVEVTDKAAHSGKYSLYTDKREQLWNGVTCNKALYLENGGYYSFGCWVMYDGEDWTDTQKFSINLQYDMDGKENYYTLYTDTANKGEWTYIGTEYTIPEEATNIYVYVQTGYKPDASVTPQDLMGFYLDDVSAERLPDPKIQTDIPSLCETYSDYFKIGCAATASELVQSAAKDLILKHYNSLTIGNELKPESLLDQQASIAYMNANGDDLHPQITLKNAKPLLDFASENNIELRGHVLVWHSQTPDWFFKENYDNNGAFVSPEVMDQRMENYIKTVFETLAKEYPDVKFYAWDVVNEAASDAGTIRKAGAYSLNDGSSGWVSVYGDQSYIKKAFQYARKYAPKGCKLFYNDYNEYSEAKMKYIQEEILAPLVKDGLIDGMGMQSHIGMSSPTIAQYENALRSYAAMGLEVQVTELDVSLKSNTEEDLLALAERYRECFEMYKRVKDDGVDLSAVVIWGITDSTSWIGGYPLLFDKDYQAKAAFDAVIDTDAEIQTIKSVPAYMLSSAFSTNTSIFDGAVINQVGDKGSFQVAYNTNGNRLSFLLETAPGAEVTVMGDCFETAASTVKNGSLELSVSPTKDLSEGDVVRFDVIIDGKAWNAQTVNTAAPDQSAYGKLTLKKRPTIAEASYGTPTIDGRIDDVWESAPEIAIDKLSSANCASGTAKILWDRRNIYVLAQVKDPVLSVASPNTYEQDTVEIFIDENNHKTSSYEEDDIQCRVSCEGEKSVTDGLSTDRFTSSAVKTDDGYLVEIAIPSTLGGYTAGQYLGFDAQVNDDGDGQGKRTGIANWYDLSGMGYTDVSGLGLLKLTGEAPDGDLMYGDATCDNKVDLQDAVAILQYIALPKKYPLTELGLKQSDTDGSGDVSGKDALVIQMVDAKIYKQTELPLYGIKL
ncbi:MAG: endo-1,4-beta-xylanase [Ruminococcus sp.]|nr:endo-1,4-beta-xylanase [Ruminococcus sp.]